MTTSINWIHRNHAPAIAAKAQFPLWTCTVLNVETWCKLDPMALGGTRVLFTTRAESMTVKVDGVDAAIFAPAGFGPIPPDPGMTIEAYEALVDQHGTMDTGEAAEEIHPDAEQDIRMALSSMSTTGEAHRRIRKEDVVEKRQGAAVARYFGLSPGDYTRLPYVPCKSLLPTCGGVPPKIETPAPEPVAPPPLLTPREWGADVIVVDRTRLTGDVGPWPDAPKMTRAVVILSKDGQENVQGVVLGSDRESWYGVPFVPGMDLPPIDKDGMRTLPRDEQAVSPDCMPHVPSLASIAFVRARMADAGADFGAVRGELRREPTEAGLEQIRQWTKDFLTKPGSIHDRRVAEYCIRRERWHPDVFVREQLRQMDVDFAALHPPYFIPTPLSAQERAMAHAGLYAAMAMDPVGPRGMREVPRFTPDELPSRAAATVAQVSALASDALVKGHYVAASEVPAASHQSTEAPQKKKAK